MMLAAAINAAGCARITETGRDGTVKEYIGFMPIIITESPGSGDIHQIEGVGAFASVGVSGVKAAVGAYRAKTVFQDACGLAIEINTNRPDLIPGWLAEPCKEGPQ